MIKKNKEEVGTCERTMQLSEEDLENLGFEDILIGASSVIGTRESQEDAMYVYKDIGKKFAIGIVCDGMGGLNGGDVASQTAVEYIKEKIDENVETDHIREKLYFAAVEADAIVKGLKTNEGTSLKGGTTLVAAIIKEGYLNWISVGDSKIYLLRDQQMFNLTKEHNYSFMAEQRKNDKTFRFDPNARQDALVSYLGAGELTYIDMNQRPVSLLDEDIIILCSDGLYKNLSEEQIRILFMSEDRDMERAADMLTTAASMDAVGSQDNTTVVVLKYRKQTFNNI